MNWISLTLNYNLRLIIPPHLHAKYYFKRHSSEEIVQVLIGYPWNTPIVIFFKKNTARRTHTKKNYNNILIVAKDFCFCNIININIIIYNNKQNYNNNNKNIKNYGKSEIFFKVCHKRYLIFILQQILCTACNARLWENR